MGLISMASVVPALVAGVLGNLGSWDARTGGNASSDELKISCEVVPAEVSIGTESSAGGSAVFERFA